MKKAAVIAMIIMHLYTNTELCELSKLGTFVTHYLDHKQLNNELTFFQYIDMHYLGHDTNDNDQEEDNKLPFKTCDCTHHLSSGITHQAHPLATIAKPAVTPVSNTFRLYNQSSLPSCYLADIWQPPRPVC